MISARPVIKILKNERISRVDRDTRGFNPHFPHHGRAAPVVGIKRAGGFIACSGKAEHREVELVEDDPAAPGVEAEYGQQRGEGGQPQPGSARGCNGPAKKYSAGGRRRERMIQDKRETAVKADEPENSGKTAQRA